MFLNRRIIVLGFCCFIGFSCKKDEDVKNAFVLPSLYDPSGFAANSTNQVSVLSQMEGVVGEIERCQTVGATTSYQALLDLYNIGSPKLSTIGNADFDLKIKAENGWLRKAALASGNSYSPIDTNGKGGVFGGYLFDESGVDIAELVEKTMFGSVIFNHATDLLAGQISNATADQLLAIMGGNPTFPNTSSSKTTVPDAFMSKYIARRDRNDGNGLYSQMKTSLIKLKAAVKGGSDFEVERDDAVVAIRLIWEKAMAASIVNYCKTVQSILSNANLTDDQKASSLHSLTEAIGFTYGLKGIAVGRKVITDAQISQLLVLFNYSETGKSNCYRFANQPLKELPKLDQAVSLIKSIYRFTDQEISDFSKNWITEQGR
jgi:hypothetical protein